MTPLAAGIIHALLLAALVVAVVAAVVQDTRAGPPDDFDDWGFA